MEDTSLVPPSPIQPVTPPTSAPATSEATVPVAVTPPLPTPPIIPPTPPTPTPTSPPPVVAPTTPPTVPTVTKSNKTIWIVVAIAGLIAVVLFLLLIKGPPGSTGATKSTTNVAVSAKYKTDTDADFIPDVIETGAGLNPAISELTRCQPASCTDSSKAATNSKKNILIILDSSGSMALTIGGKSRMDAAKEAVRQFVANSGPDDSIGLMQYGYLGSNATSGKSASCGSTQLVAAIGEVTKTSVDGFLAKIKPVGWTPTGLALKKSVDAFSGKEGQTNKVIVVSDGAETCDTNPVGEAANLTKTAYKVQVDVIGFAASAADQASMKAIATSGGGSFAVASTLDELLIKIKDSVANFKAFQTDVACIDKAYTSSLSCMNATKLKVSTYMNGLLAKAKGTENKELAALQASISKAYQDKYNLIDTEWAKLKKERQSLIN